MAQPLPNSVEVPLTAGVGVAPAGLAPSVPPARPEVEHLQAYSAPLEGRRGLLRLDFNENTVGPSPKVVEAIRAIPADHYAIYPEYDGLRQAVVASLAAAAAGAVAASESGGTAGSGTEGSGTAGSGTGAGQAGARQIVPRQPAASQTVTGQTAAGQTVGGQTVGVATEGAGTEGCAGLTAAHIGLFNGVDAAIHAVFHAYGDRGDRLLTTSPTFGYYSPCAQMQGMEIEAIPYGEPDFAFPLQALTAALLRPGVAPPKLLLICNPNNPTGTRLAPERILALAAAAPQTLVVVDELYEAFTGDSVLPGLLAGGLAPAAKGLAAQGVTVQAPVGSSLGSEACRASARAPSGSACGDPFAACPNLLVLRSLAKTAGLAGLRIGFAIGAPAVVDRLSRVTGPYDINSVAVTAALAALADQAYVDAYVAEVSRARDWLVDQLVAAGVRHHVAGGNYLLIWPRADAALVEARLRQAGILVRSMAGKPLIDGSLRVSLGLREQMERFWAAYAAIEAPQLA